MSDLTVIIPEEKISAGDLTDRAINKLECAAFALRPDPKEMEEFVIESIRITIEEAIRDLALVRKLLLMR